MTPDVLLRRAPRSTQCRTSANAIAGNRLRSGLYFFLLNQVARRAPVREIEEHFMRKLLNRTASTCGSLAIAALVLAGCGTDSAGESEFTTQSTTTSSSSATSSSSSSATTEPENEQSESVDAQPAVAEEPYVVECLQGTPGPAVWSDGTVAHSDWCFEQNGGAEYLEAEGKSGLDGYTEDLSNVPYANGGTCPAYKCGYGYDENGNPYPSSGELQAHDGCQAGYIDDPDLCAAVAEKVGPYGNPAG